MSLNARFVRPDGAVCISFPINKRTSAFPGISGLAIFERGHYKWVSTTKFQPLFIYPSKLHSKERLKNLIPLSDKEMMENMPHYPNDVKDSSKNFLYLY